MRTFLISYDLAQPSNNKHALSSTVMSLGSAWARPLESTWYVRADVSETEIEQRLSALLDADDGLLVQAVDTPALLSQTSLRWFRQRRHGADAHQDTNVIAFPVRDTPAVQEELPLAS
jgi:hypothetical protein